MAMNPNSPKSVCNAMSNIEFAKSLRKYDRIEVSHIIDLKIRLSSFNRNFSFALAMVEAMALHKLREAEFNDFNAKLFHRYTNSNYWTIRHFA
jgi:hypothetical protein